MEKKKSPLRKLTFSKEILCAYCSYRPKPEDLGKACPQCGGRYKVVDIEQRQPFAQDNRQTSGI